MKIVFPDLDVTLFDSLQKRLTFLDEVIDKLKLKNIKTVHGRAEEFGRKLDYREKYDIVVSRAVAELTPLCELALPFCKVGGKFISYKGGKGGEELKNAEYAIKNHAAIFADKKISEVIEKILKDPSKLAEMSLNAKKLSKVNAASNIVQIILNS